MAEGRCCYLASYVFKRYELKYLLDETQYATIKAEIDGHLVNDGYGNKTVQSLYFDTDNYRLIRASMEKPLFKEKLRLRCYGLNTDNREIYLEMKRKCNGIVYKRRIACSEQDVPALLAGQLPQTQIGKEIDYFMRFYGNLTPKMLILYDRLAMLDRESDLRVTFDRNIRYRTQDLNFYTSLQGKSIMPGNTVLMELKAGAAFPLWLCRALSNTGAAKTAFSKYGTAYTDFLSSTSAYI